jgi:hypothetical protein
MWRILASRSALRAVPVAVALSLVLLGGTAGAFPGDIQEVTAERANLRAGPSERAETLGQVERGDELIELQRQGDWLGVRVIRSGEEGWIHGNLVELSSATRLGRDTEPAGFKDLSAGFDSLMRTIEEHHGYRLVERVEVTENRTLRVAPTREWLIYGGRQDHLLAVLAFYQMWKDNQDGQSVNVSLIDESGGQYITISDDSSGPSLTIHPVAED